MEPFGYSEDAPDAGAPAAAPTAAPAPAIDTGAAPMPACSAPKVYAAGTCGVYQDAKTLRACSIGCTYVADGEPVSEAGCLTMGQHHFIHQQYGTNERSSTWDDPEDSILGPIVCVRTLEECSSLCH